MTLLYAEEMTKIENCPLGNDQRDMILYRLIKDATTVEADLLPKATNPRTPNLKTVCEGWGISTYDSLKEITTQYRGMNERLQSRFSHIAEIRVQSGTGVKYQTGENDHHICLFPYVEADVVNQFTTVIKL